MALYVGALLGVCDIVLALPGVCDMVVHFREFMALSEHMSTSGSL